jgi:hypothetical protein
MAGVIIAVTVAGRHPDGARVRRISVITANPDPCPVYPFMMTADPDGGAIGTRPGMLHDNRRRRNTDLDAHIDSRGFARACKGHDAGYKCQRSQTKRSFHNLDLD